MTVLAGARLVTPSGARDGWLDVDAGRITELGTGPVPPDADDLGGGWLVPGFVDLHMHGGGGHDVTGSPEDMCAAVEFHRTRGTTTTLVSLMTAPVDDLGDQLAWAAELTASGDIAGAHLEGPFLASARCGAQDHRHLLDPDPLVLAKLLDAAQGAVRTVTVAPELPGALELIRDIVAAGAVAAIGHTDADYRAAEAGFAAGATLVTHLFNAMGPVTQREPGPAIAALDSTAVLEVINDGVHVHDALTRLVARHDPRRLALITDSISAAGVGDGEYRLGAQPVVVVDGQPRLPTSGRLAGSTLTMDEAFRRAVLELGLSMEHAAAAASTNPARVLGLEQRTGVIAAGLAADLVHLDDDLRVVRVMRHGTWLTAAG
jgi:N-acetylglucosamine-6-phosphate deacetylase